MAQLNKTCFTGVVLCYQGYCRMGELGHWCKLGQKFSESPPLQLLVRDTGVNCQSVNGSPCYCSLMGNPKGDDSLNFCPNSHQCPNSPHSTVYKQSYVTIHICGILMKALTVHI